MIDLFVVFTRGGSVLWKKQLVTVEGNPINDLVQNVLIDERAGKDVHQVGEHMIKWVFANDLDLVFAAVYLHISQMLWLKDMLEGVKKEFCAAYREKVLSFASPDAFDFDARYEKLLTKFETKGFAKSAGPRSQAELNKARALKKAASTTEEPPTGTDGAILNDAQDIVSPVDPMPKFPPRRTGPGPSRKGPGPSRKNRKKGGGGGGDEPASPSKGKKVMRKWEDTPLSQNDIDEMDFTDKREGEGEDDGSATRAQFGEAPMDDAYMDESSSDEEEEEKSSKAGGILGFFQKISGNKVLAEEDVADVIAQFRDSLMSKNVAADIADQLCKSVVTNMVGKKLASFTTIKSTVRACVEEALTKILTPKKTTDVLQGILKAKEQKRPYVVVFVGVNGVGKSTSLAKVAAYFMSKGLKVSIAACDTFRSGAIEQLRTHAKALGVTVYDRGYNRDAASVAKFAIAQSAQEGQDVILVDTAGRMQDNHPLMVSLAKLITVNNPDLILFVGEALVGNDAVDQLVKFNRCLKDLSDNPSNPRLVDGIVLTKFDTIDDKVGAAISMTYTTGQPIMFVGVGQTYKDLRRMNVKLLIKALLK
mmetsp:Transcript_46912/g.92335  ORF Transcript_46912/g.92335 Transcript_46912/m.92335 type:complete len:591 (+) Transcript_46912:31-1803(+)